MSWFSQVFFANFSQYYLPLTLSLRSFFMVSDGVYLRAHIEYPCQVEKPSGSFLSSGLWSNVRYQTEAESTDNSYLEIKFTLGLLFTFGAHSNISYNH